MSAAAYGIPLALVTSPPHAKWRESISACLSPVTLNGTDPDRSARWRRAGKARPGCRASAARDPRVTTAGALAGPGG